MSTPPPSTLPELPGGLFNVPPDSVLVEDADEEIMELYMNLEATTGRADSGGLGYLDATAAELELSFELAPPAVQADTVKQARGKRAKPAKPITVDLTVVQDPSALRARVGDTVFSGAAGELEQATKASTASSRPSLYLARHLLTQHHFSPPSPLLDATRLAAARVLELGAGTGVLAALMAPLCGHYVATDRAENLRLVQRNVSANAPKAGTSSFSPSKAATVAPLDWAEVAAEAGRKAKSGARYVPPESDTDLVLAVDCIYNESLVAPLVDTLAAMCARGALAWVVVELRSSDVLTLFLDTWLQHPAGFKVVRLGESAMGAWEGERGRWVGWVGWCPPVDEHE